MRKYQIVGNKNHTLPNGENVEYVEFIGDQSSTLAQYLWGKIIVNQFVFKNYSEDTHNVVLAHELGHKKTPSYVLIPLNLIMVFSLLAIFLSLMSILLIVLSLISNHATMAMIMSLLFTTFLGELVLLLIFMTASWLSEGIAELYAISVVGPDAYHRHLRERKEKHGLRKISKFERIRCALSYPPTPLILWIHSKLPKNLWHKAKI